jgi:hypothetical protein
LARDREEKTKKKGPRYREHHFLHRGRNKKYGLTVRDMGNVLGGGGGAATTAAAPRSRRRNVFRQKLKKHSISSKVFWLGRTDKSWSQGGKEPLQEVNGA